MQSVLSFYFMSSRSKGNGAAAADDLPLRVHQPVVHVTDSKIVGTHASGPIASVLPSLLIPNAGPLAYTLTLSCKYVRAHRIAPSPFSSQPDTDLI